MHSSNTECEQQPCDTPTDALDRQSASAMTQYSEKMLVEVVASPIGTEKTMPELKFTASQRNTISRVLGHLRSRSTSKWKSRRLEGDHISVNAPPVEKRARVVVDVTTAKQKGIPVTTKAGPSDALITGTFSTLHKGNQVPPTMHQSTLFKHATIITYDMTSKRLKVLRNASMLIRNGRVIQLAEGELLDVPAHAEVIDASHKIISPGFVNTHHHMWQTALRTLAANTTLNEYFTRYGQTGPASKLFTPEDLYLGQLTAAVEFIDNGTTTVLDHAHGTFSSEHVDAAIDASSASGLRIVHAHSVDPHGASGMSYQESMAKFKALLEDGRFVHRDNLMMLGLAYDGFAIAPPEQSMEVMDFVINHNNEIHQSQTTAPVSVITSHYVGGPYGFLNSPQTLHSMPTSVLTQPSLKHKLPVILSHASFLLRQHPHVSISTTPESEAHYGHTSTGADMCQDCASLGADTNFIFSSYMPLQARMWMQSLRSKHYTQVVKDNWEIPANNPMAVEDAFLLMTQKGGAALGRDDIGVIREGAVADLVIFDTRSRPSLWGARDPVAAIVLHTGGGGDVDGVMVDGRWLKRDGRIVSPLIGEKVEVEDIRKRFERSADRIQRLWEEMEPVVFEAGEAAGVGSRFAKSRIVSVRRQ